MLLYHISWLIRLKNYQINKIILLSLPNLLLLKHKIIEIYNFYKKGCTNEKLSKIINI